MADSIRKSDIIMRILKNVSGLLISFHNYFNGNFDSLL